MEKKTGNRKLIWAAILLAVLVAVFAIVYRNNRPAPQEGTKAYSLTVVDDMGAEKSYSGKAAFPDTKTPGGRSALPPGVRLPLSYPTYFHPPNSVFL